MIAFVGMMALNGKQLDASRASELIGCIETNSICADLDWDKEQCESFLLLSSDTGVYADKGWRDDDIGVTAVAGDPLIRGDAAHAKNIADDVSRLHSSRGDSLVHCLQHAKGVFSGVSIRHGCIDVYSDKLGVRPVYFYQDKHVVIFSSLLWVLESLSFIDLDSDPKGVAEIVALGYCLADRTPYRSVKRLNGGELLSLDMAGNELRRIKYWDWASINVKNEVTEHDITCLYEAFTSAVNRRRTPGEPAVAFLSGGLDSRSIVSLLAQNEEEVYTFNFATQRAQDNECARLFAEAAGVRHHQRLFATLAYPNWSQLIANEVSSHPEMENVECVAHKVWSGDGGSVGMGYVYLDNVELAQHQPDLVQRAVETFLHQQKIGLPVKLLKKAHRSSLPNYLKEGMESEFVAVESEPSKSVYHFLMNNDQKRHLHVHFETICEHKVELLLPFFDSDFLQQVYALPTEAMKFHRLYMRWFSLFPDCARSTPWQSYPGHEPCPVPMPEGLSYQWGKKVANRSRRNDCMRAFAALRQPVVRRYVSFPRALIAIVVHAIGVKDYRYLIESINRLAGLRS
jgi:hypothetical protein